MYQDNTLINSESYQYLQHHQGHYTPLAHTVHTATIWQTLHEHESQNNQT